jgi:uncharacterized damage-inducible protein DinB
MRQHFATFARYNRWANRRLYDAVAELPELPIHDRQAGVMTMAR